MLTLGESGREAVYFHLEKTFGIKKNEWHRDVEGFAEALEQIFGPGAQFLLRAIVKELYITLSLKFEEQKPFHFANLIHRAENMHRFICSGGVYGDEVVSRQRKLSFRATSGRS